MTHLIGAPQAIAEQLELRPKVADVVTEHVELRAMGGDLGDELGVVRRR